MTKSPDCPMCKTSNPWVPKKSNETYHYKGWEFTLNDTEYSVCRECEFDVVLPTQKRRNEARIRDEHRRIDGLLTGPEIKAIRKRLRLSQAKAAELIGGGVNAFSKYERGEVTQSVAMNQLLLVLADTPEALAVLEGHKSSRSVEKTPVLSAVTIPVSDRVSKPLIPDRRTKRVRVRTTRNYDVKQLLAA